MQPIYVVYIFFGIILWCACMYMAAYTNEEKGFESTEGAILALLFGPIGLFVVILRPYKPSEERIVKVISVPKEETESKNGKM